MPGGRRMPGGRCMPQQGACCAPLDGPVPDERPDAPTVTPRPRPGAGGGSPAAAPMWEGASPILRTRSPPTAVPESDGRMYACHTRRRASRSCVQCCTNQTQAADHCHSRRMADTPSASGRCSPSVQRWRRMQHATPRAARSAAACTRSALATGRPLQRVAAVRFGHPTGWAGRGRCPKRDSGLCSTRYGSRTVPHLGDGQRRCEIQARPALPSHLGLEHVQHLRQPAHLSRTQVGRCCSGWRWAFPAAVRRIV